MQDLLCATFFQKPMFPVPALENPLRERPGQDGDMTSCKGFWNKTPPGVQKGIEERGFEEILFPLAHNLSWVCGVRSSDLPFLLAIADGSNCPRITLAVRKQVSELLWLPSLLVVCLTLLCSSLELLAWD